MNDFLELLEKLWQAAGEPEIAKLIAYLIAVMGVIGVFPNKRRKSGSLVIPGITSSAW